MVGLQFRFGLTKPHQAFRSKINVLTHRIRVRKTFFFYIIIFFSEDDWKVKTAGQ